MIPFGIICFTTAKINPRNLGIRYPDMNKLSILPQLAIQGRGRDRMFPRARRKQPTSSMSPSSLTWARTYNIKKPTWYPGYQCGLPLNTGGYFLCAKSGLVSSAVTEQISKLSAEGKIVWSRIYYNDTPPYPTSFINSVRRTADGGFIGVGENVASSLHSWVIKFSENGDIEWSDGYDLEYADKADHIQQTREGGYVVSGSTNKFDENGDLMVIKLTPLRDVEWAYVYGGPDQDSDWGEGYRTTTILQTSDGGYLLAADSYSFGAGGTDIWILKLSSTGGIEWQKTYGGSESEWFSSPGPHVQLTEDGEYIVACRSFSFDKDLWLFKVSSKGNIRWQRGIGGSKGEEIGSIQPTADGGFILAGGSNSFNSAGSVQAWLLKLDSHGDIEWQKVYGKDSPTEAHWIQQAPDGGYAVFGVSGSALVMKVTSTGEVGPPGSEFSGNSNAGISDTNVVPSDTFITPILVTPKRFEVSVKVIDVTDQATSEVLCWDLNQPPINLVLKREINRGVFRGEAFNYLSWQPDPWNSRFVIREYKIYRRPANAADYQLIGRVDGNIFMYIDGYLKMEDKFAYVVTSVDSDGNESPKSKSVQNE